MPTHTISRFLRSHFLSGPKRVMILSERRLIIQAAGLHRSFGGKLPNANRVRFVVTTFQLALKISHSIVFKKTELLINMMTKLTIVLKKLENNVKNKSLFNTKLFSKNIELAYEKIYQRNIKNLPAENIE